MILRKNVIALACIPKEARFAREAIQSLCAHSDIEFFSLY